MKNFEQGKKEIPDIILFPSSYLNSRQVDEALQAEYDAVKKTGLFDVWLFSYDKWFNEGKLVLDYPVTYLRSAIYRGWMMKPAQYKDFYDCLLENNIKLITSPEQYENLHIFPNAYKYISDDTVRILTYPLHEEIDINTVKEQFSRFMVKDYVKSVKGSNFPKCFDHTITQEEFNQWMEVFYKYRGNLLTGGICIKEYIDLKRYGDKTNEYRVFYVNNEVATISRNSSQGSNAPLPPQEIVDKYKNLKSNYYTVDYAELADGTWKIIEVGDGSVSGLSDVQDYVQYYEELHRCMLINILND